MHKSTQQHLESVEKISTSKITPPIKLQAKPYPLRLGTYRKWLSPSYCMRIPSPKDMRMTNLGWVLCRFQVGVVDCGVEGREIREG